MKKVLCFVAATSLLVLTGSLPLKAKRFSDIKELEKYINSLDKFETIELEGHYTGTLRIKRPVHIKGNGAVFDGQRKGDIIVVEKTASGTIIEGLVIKNSGRSLYFYHSGIKVDKATNIIIKNNKFIDCLNAVYLIKSHNTKVLNNYSRGLARELSEEKTGDGIHLFACKHVLVKGNRIYEHRDGTYMEYSHHVDTIDNVYSGHLRYGLHFMFSKDNYFEGNIFEKNGTGASIMYTERVTLRHNIFRYNRGHRAYAILFKDADKVLVEENFFLENTIGLFMDNSNKNIIHNNLFVGNGWTIDLFSSCERNIFYENAFVANTYEVSSNIRRTNNHFYHPEKKIGNYWDDYEGYDWNGDGIGDVPHNPVTFFGIMAKRYPDITIFAKSPVAAAIDFAEKALPIVSTSDFEDKYPLMRWKGFDWKPENLLRHRSYPFLFASFLMVGLPILGLIRIMKV